MADLDFTEIITKIVATSAVKEAFQFSIETLKNTDRKSRHKLEDLADSLQNNLKRTANWTTYTTSLPEVEGDKFLDDNHIYLDFYLKPLKYSYGENGPKKEINLIQNFLQISSRHVILLGGPGSGKTTSMKMLSRNILLSRIEVEYSFPFVVRFREHSSTLLNHTNKHVLLGHHSIDISKISPEKIEEHTKRIYANNLLFSLIYRELGLSLDHRDDEQLYRDFDSGFIKNYVINILEKLNCLVILEGFDEIPQIVQFEMRKEIEFLCLSLNNSKVVITSRTNTFDTIESAKAFEIAPLTEKKILDFSLSWLDSEEKAESFVEQVKGSPFYDTTIRPLNLTFLIALFESNGYLPPKPWSVYKEIVDLLITKWDRQRHIRRKSKFAGFIDSDKYSFLTLLAFELSKREDTSFTPSTLGSVFRNNTKRFGLQKEEVNEIVAELEASSGLFVNSGYHKFEFPHKCLQEFLSAEYISNYRPLSKISHYLAVMPNELAVFISFSTNKNHVFSECLKVLGPDTRDKFLNRIILEKIDFEEDFYFGVTLCELFADFALDDPDKEIWVTFCNLSGIKESCKLLLNFYEVEPLQRDNIFSLKKRSRMVSDSPHELKATAIMFD
ncbi:MAG: NACHT domain-containing protein [Cytophagales bacterium]|nr:NACHT domain-containing protein [Cytophagales bacterium]